MAQPPSPAAGEVYLDTQYYQDPPGSPPWLPKFLLVLCRDRAGDHIYRLLTTRHGSPEPRCYHGNPYSGFYLGVLAGALREQSWVDLRRQPIVLDDLDFRSNLRQGRLTFITHLDPDTLCAVLDCASRADDVMPRDSAAMRDQMAALGCRKL